VSTDNLYAWRALLGKMISDLQERQRIADALGVTTITLTRWATKKSNPRMESLRLLLRTLPSHRQQFIELIQEEFPNFMVEDVSAEKTLQEIPSAFYDRVLRAYASSPPLLRASSIRITILQQILSHLDPTQFGLAISISQCILPSARQKVRSLREEMGRGNLPWRSHLENRTQFLGIESLPGYAVSTGHAVVVQSREEKSFLFPTHHVAWEQSAVAQPLLLSDRITGCLYISSTQQNYFSEARQYLIRSYADLLLLAFEHDQFYNIEQMALGTMPPYEIQKPYLARFQQRVVQHMIQATQQNQPVTRLQAELLVTQELEKELLLLPYEIDNTPLECE